MRTVHTRQLCVGDVIDSPLYNRRGELTGRTEEVIIESIADFHNGIQPGVQVAIGGGAMLNIPHGDVTVYSPI